MILKRISKESYHAPCSQLPENEYLKQFQVAAHKLLQKEPDLWYQDLFIEILAKLVNDKQQSLLDLARKIAKNPLEAIQVD